MKKSTSTAPRNHPQILQLIPKKLRPLNPAPFLLLLLLSACTASPSTLSLLLTSSERADAHAADILEKTKITLPQHALTFADLVDQFRRDTGLQWVIEEKSLSGTIEPATSLSLTLPQPTSISTILFVLRRQYYVEYFIHDGIVILTTIDSARPYQRSPETLCIYDVSDLSKLVILEDAPQPGFQGGDHARGPKQLFEDWPNLGKKVKVPGAYALEIIILKNIQSSDWINNGGNYGTVQALSNNLLLVRALPSTQRQVQSFLTSLRQVQKNAK